jgi:hypothetical protein
MAQHVASQVLANRLEFELFELALRLIGMVFRIGSAIGQRVILVRFLGIGIGSDLYKAMDSTYKKSE